MVLLKPPQCRSCRSCTLFIFWAPFAHRALSTPFFRVPAPVLQEALHSWLSFWEDCRSLGPTPAASGAHGHEAARLFAGVLSGGVLLRSSSSREPERETERKVEDGFPPLKIHMEGVPGWWRAGGGRVQCFATESILGRLEDETTYSVVFVVTSSLPQTGR